MSLANKLTEERRNRLAAERLLELKQAELSAANRKLGKHAQQLSEEIVETRAQVETIRGENKRVKSDLSVARQKIIVAERRLWHSIETINDGFAFFNADNELIMGNQAYLAVFDGIEAIGPGVNYVTILQVMTDEGIVNTGDMAPSAWRSMMTERVTHNAPEPITIQLWDESYVKLVDQRGPDGDMVSLWLDITATVAYEEQLKEARAIAESANRAKSAFLANMSHEIRTPMNGVIGMADILIDSGLDEEQQLFVETIKNSGEALLVIINDVLDYSKIEAKKLDLHPEPFDLERALQEVLMLLQPSAHDKDLSLRLDYDMFLPTTMIGDPGRVRQVMTNLIGNAVKFTAEGHVLVRVTGVPNLDNRELDLHVTIEDTGIGIPEDMIDHIFGEFNQVENERNRQFDGTGLGLAITQRLVALMGGEIWVTSEDGAGSCFGFRVPMELTELSEIPEWSKPAALQHTVVVDPTEINRVILQRQLSQLGIKVSTFGSAKEAFACFNGDVDLLIAQSEELLPLLSFLHAEGTSVPILALCADDRAASELGPENLAGTLTQCPGRLDLFTALSNIDFDPEVPLPAAAPPTAAVPADVAPPTKRLMRILAAEDNKTNQLVFKKMIKDLNMELTFANNGEEAVKLYQEIEPDLIFMDISMPKMDGKEATRAIRKIEGDGPHTTIVALTAHAMEGDDTEILAAGLDRYLTKPLRKPKIVGEIENAHTNGMEPLYQEDDVPLQDAG